MFDTKVLKKRKNITHKVENVYGQQIITDVSEYLNIKTKKKYAVKKKIIPTFNP
jgi:hypothetical protein